MKKVVLAMVVLFLAFGQTLFMYFWQDDFALIFKLMHQAEPMGSFGSGIIGEGPYKYLVTVFVPFFPLFNINPFGYFFVGFILLFVIVFLFYKLNKEIFIDKTKAYFATLVFASGYIGSEIMFRVINSWQTNIGLILAFLSLLFFVRFLRQKRIIHYLLSLLFFYNAVEFVYVRSHSLVFCFLTLDFIFLFSNFKVSKIKYLILRQVPFWGIFYFKYLKDVPAGQTGINNFIHEVANVNFEYLAGLFGTIGNAAVPDFYQSKLISVFPLRFNLIVLILFLILAFILVKTAKLRNYQRIIMLVGLPVLFLVNESVFARQAYWYNSVSSFLSVSIGLYISFLSIIMAFFLWNRKRELAIGILVGYLFLVSQFFGYYIDYPTTIFPTTHRYLSYSAFGYAILVTYLVGIIVRANKKMYTILVSVVVASNLVLGITYQGRLVRDRSIATEKFYHDLIRFQPKVNKHAIFYFDLQNNGFVRGQFRDFFSVGSMPDSTALAIWYGLDRDEIHFVEDYDEFLDTLNQYKDVNNIYTFYYGKDGLRDTTEEMRNALSKDSSFIGTFNEFNIKGDLKFTALDTCEVKMMSPKLQNYLNYLKDKDTYYKTVKIETLSEWRGQETLLAVDNNPDTSWRGHRIYWNDHKNEALILDLQKNYDFDKIRWINTHNTLTPTSYQILVSNDKNTWELVKNVSGEEKKTGAEVIDTFSSVNARYVKINFLDTLSDDSPAISEIEVVKTIYSIEDMFDTRKLIIDPLNYIDECSFKNSFDELAKYLRVDVNFQSDKGVKKQEILLNELNKADFKVIAQVGGTNLVDVKIDIRRLPMLFEIKSIKNKAINFNEIIQKGLVKSFSRN